MQGSCVPKGIFKILPRRAPGTERDPEESVTYRYVTQEGLGEIPGTKVDLDLSKGLNENPEGLTLRKEARIPGAAGITRPTVRLGDVQGDSLFPEQGWGMKSRFLVQLRFLVGFEEADAGF